MRDTWFEAATLGIAAAALALAGIRIAAVIAGSGGTQYIVAGLIGLVCAAIWVNRATSHSLPILIAVSAAAFVVTAWWIWMDTGVQSVAARVNKGLAAASGTAPSVGSPPSIDLQQLGQVGDLFGGINAAFAALAFVGVAAAAGLQLQSLKLLQVEHVSNTFEPLFTILLARPEFPSSLSANQTTFLHTSRSGDHPSSTLIEDIRKEVQKGSHYPASGILKRYEEVYGANDGALGVYFRSLFHLYKYIAQSALPEGRKLVYVNIARSQLTPDMLLMLMLNCATERGSHFKPLVERFGLLKHCKSSDLDDLLGPLGYAKTAALSDKGRQEHWATHPEHLSALNRAIADI